VSDPNPASYQDPKYWENLAHAAQYKLGLAEARVAQLEALCSDIAKKVKKVWGAGEYYFWLKSEDHEKLSAAGRGETIE
jgi:hypothetical protein